MNAIIGRKLGMTRIFSDDGTATPVTIIEAGPCPVMQVRDTAGRKSVQLGFGSKRETRATKAETGHARAAGVEAVPSVLQEFPVADGTEINAGDVVKADVFAVGDFVKVTGTSKGRGFQGVVKRYGFAGGPATHGNTRYRRPGSMGPGTDPSRVIKGKKLPGHHGARRHTELGLRVEQVDVERNLIFVRGSVPGPMKSLVTLRKQEARSRYA